MWEWENEVIQSCLTLRSPMNCLPTPSSPPGSSIHGIFQARILEWVSISFSKGSSGPRDGTHCRQTLPHCRQTLPHSRQTLYHLSHQGTHQGLPSSWGRKESDTTFTDISINPRCIFPIFLYFHQLQLAFCLRPSLVTHLPSILTFSASIWVIVTPDMKLKLELSEIPGSFQIKKNFNFIYTYLFN